MSGVSRHTKWASYGPCHKCGAEDAQPCWDLRRANTVARRPHPGRHVRGYLPPRRDAIVRWFGEPWGAPFCDPELRIEVPPGMICFGHDHMHEGRTVEIMASDQGVTMPYVRDDRTVGRCAYHLDCWLHEVGADRLR